MFPYFFAHINGKLLLEKSTQTLKTSFYNRSKFVFKHQ